MQGLVVLAGPATLGAGGSGRSGPWPVVLAAAGGTLAVVVVLVLMTWRDGGRRRERERDLVDGLTAWAGEHGWDVRVGAAAGELGLARAGSAGSSTGSVATGVVAAAEGDWGEHRVALVFARVSPGEAPPVEVATVIVRLQASHPRVAVRNAVFPFTRRRAPTGEAGFDRWFAIEPGDLAARVTPAMRELLVAWRRSGESHTRHALVVEGTLLTVTRQGWAFGVGSDQLVDRVVAVAPDGRAPGTAGDESHSRGHGGERGS